MRWYFQMRFQWKRGKKKGKALKKRGSAHGFKWHLHFKNNNKKTVLPTSIFWNWIFQFQFGISGLLNTSFLIQKCHGSGILTIQNHCIKVKSPSKSIRESYWKKVFIPLIVKCIYYILIFWCCITFFKNRFRIGATKCNYIAVLLFLILAARLLLWRHTAFQKQNKNS